MAFISKIKNQSHFYYQLRESKRINGKVTQKVLCHMGKNLEIPRHIIREYRISQENLKRIRSKYPTLKITN